MEDDDFTIDEDGQLDLRYRGWTEIDTTIFTLVQEIIVLDLSFNQLQCLPDEIGLLKKVTHFNCACNALTEVPATIGRLRRLKELRLNGNKLTELPSEISNCCRLSVLYLNENNVVRLPDSIGDCSNLTMLRLENNDLACLPLTLAKLKNTLEILNVENNPNLSIVRPQMQGNSAVIMWIICLLDKHAVKLRTLNNSILRMSMLGQRNQAEIEESRKLKEILRQEKEDLLQEQDSVKNFIIVRDWWRKCEIKAQQWKSFCKNMFARDNVVPIELKGED